MFRTVIDKLNLQELKGEEPFFTQNNRRKGGALTWAHLDKIFVNMRFLNLNGKGYRQCINTVTLDHYALVS